MQLYPSAQFCLGIAEDDGFLRQPFQCRTGLDVQFQLLKGRAGGAIPFGRAGAGQLCPGIGTDGGRDIQPVTPGDTARWMNDDVLAHLRTFGVQMLLHAQRSFVAPQCRACAVIETAVTQFQLGVPAGGEEGGVGRQVHGVFIGLSNAAR